MRNFLKKENFVFAFITPNALSNIKKGSYFNGAVLKVVEI